MKFKIILILPKRFIIIIRNFLQVTSWPIKRRQDSRIEHQGFNLKTDSDMSYIMVDVESDGPIPGDYSMICFRAVLVEPSLEKIFYGKLKPISEKWIPEALAVSGFSRANTLMFDDPKNVMNNYAAWIAANSKGRPFFISDNNGFDWQFINWYFYHFTGKNPFGHSSSNLGSLYIRFREGHLFESQTLEKRKIYAQSRR